MSTSEQLEREAEQTRAQLAATLEELRARMTPGQVVDQLVDYASESGGGEFFRNLRRQVVSNPLPVAMMGAGLVWLSMSGRRADSYRPAGNSASWTADKMRQAGDGVVGRARHAADGTSKTANEWSDQARSTAADMTDRAQRKVSDLQDATLTTADKLADTAASTYDAAAQSVAETYDAAAGKARTAGETIKGSVSGMRGNAAATGQTVMNFFNEQPLVLAGIGIALGAIIGAALPSTDTEDALMGESGDAVKRQTAQFAGEQMKKGEAVAEQAWQGAKQEAEKQGFSPSADGDSDASTPYRHSENEEAPLVPSTGVSAGREKERSES
jgi:hypothetical protein